MKIRHVHTKRVTEPVQVLDCWAGEGYRQGPGGALADVDIDFQSDRRQEVKEYLERRYNVNGKQRVFSAGTMTTLKIKAAIKDVSRVYKVPLPVVNYVTAIFDDDKMTWTDLFKLAAINKKVKKFITDYPQVIEDIRPLMGQPRSASVHASAILITPESKDGKPVECFDYTPIKKTDDMLVSEFDGYSLDEVGLLKNDCLGIKELSKIQQTINECNRVYGSDISFDEIVKGDLDDRKTYEILTKGFTQNVFQFSSRGMTKFLMDMRPACIEDLTAAAALYRPAPIEAGSTEKYLLCKRGDITPEYLWGTYEALKGTYGTLVFQEELAQMAREVGGFSLAEGVRLLKLISKKKTDVIHLLKEQFMTGAAAKGCPAEDTAAIWEMIEAGGGYLFNKSHATAYAVTSYVGAYLKANYPTAFYTIALQWADDKEIPALMSEMEQCSAAKIVPPDVNVSGVQFMTDYAHDRIFWSLTRIKMVGIKTSAYIIQERNRNGNYTSVENFLHRIFRRKLKQFKSWDDPEDVQDITRVPVNARHVRHLILAGCFDETERINCLTGRYGILMRAADLLGFTLNERDFPPEMLSEPYYWSMQQISVSGIGSIDYRSIFEGSDAKILLKGKVSYMSLADALYPDHEGRRIAVCATVTEAEEKSYTDKTTGQKKRFAKIVLQQNNETMELVVWDDYLSQYKEDIAGLKDKVIIVSCIIKYSDFSGTNSLNSYKSTILHQP